MIIEIKFKPTFNLLASILMASDMSRKLPDNISKAWIRDQFTNHFYINGVDVRCMSNYYDKKYLEMAIQLNIKYSLELEECDESDDF